MADKSPQERLQSLLTDELIDLLDELYPNRCPDLSLPDREVWARSGERRLVDTLKAINEQRNVLHP